MENCKVPQQSAFLKHVQVFGDIKSNLPQNSLLITRKFMKLRGLNSLGVLLTTFILSPFIQLLSFYSRATEYTIWDFFFNFIFEKVII